MSRPGIQRAFTVRPVWDEEAGVWITDGDVRGLHVEADTVEELERLVMAFAPGLIVANHLSADDKLRKTLQSDR